MINCGEDVTEVEVKPDGSWRVKAKSESERLDLGNLAQWHFPNGSLCVSTDGDVKRVETLKQVKQEGVSDSPPGLKLGIRKNRNGVWEVSKPLDTNTSSGHRLKEVFGNPEQVIIPMSSSATGSGRDGDDPSVNQGGGGHIDYSTTNGTEMDSVCFNNVNLANGLAAHTTSAQVGGTEVIDLISDSEEDNDILVSPAIPCKNIRNDTADGYSVPPPGIVDSYTEDQNLGGNSCLGLFPNEDDYGMSSLWSLPPATQAGPGFQLFGSDADVSDALVHLQHDPINCTSSLNGYALAPDTAMGSSSLLQDSSAGRSDADLNGGLVDNPLAFGDDPALQIFLPTRPAESSVQNELRDQANVSNGVCTEDWISLSLGGGAGGSNGDASTQNGLNSRHQIPARDSVTNTLADTGLLLFDPTNSEMFFIGSIAFLVSLL